MSYSRTKHKRTGSFSPSHHRVEEGDAIVDRKGKSKESSKPTHRRTHSFSDPRILEKQGAKPFKDKGKEKDNTAKQHEKTSREATASVIAYSKGEGLIGRLHKKDTQNAFIRDCTTDGFKINGKQFNQYQGWLAVSEEERNSFSEPALKKRKKVLIEFMAIELYAGDLEVATAAYEALSLYYTQNPVNTRVADALTTSALTKHDAFINFTYEVDIRADKNNTRVVTTFQVAGLRAVPGSKASSEKDDGSTYEGTIVQTMLLAKKPTARRGLQFKGLQSESLYFTTNKDNKVEELYLASANEQDKAFYLLNKEANALLALCEEKKINGKIRDGNLIKSIEKMVQLLAEKGATSKNLSLLNSVIKYAKAILASSNEYHPSNIENFATLQQEINVSPLGSREKQILLNLLQEINYQRFLEELVNVQNKIAKFPRLEAVTLPSNITEEERRQHFKFYKQLTVEGVKIADTIRVLSEDKKHSKDIPFYTGILDKTNFIMKTVQSQLNTSPQASSQASSSGAQIKLNKVLTEYQRDVDTLKTRTNKSVNLLAESMLRLKGIAMLLLGSLSVGLASFTVGLGNTNAFGHIDSSYQLARAGHALLFKPNVEIKERKTKESKLGEAIQAYTALTKLKRQ